ncbi:hypothetical protein GDO81_020560 [Engystomops pustulosus]|uniref:Uncharacterized protein n=1 Tax=Engystomops pustulosus TaxID=76066 RepID=A0AAV6YX40_ENGPU|nr:hypothetical protein GDO81_020560 [Engystomops pustulosus]
MLTLSYLIAGAAFGIRSFPWRHEEELDNVEGEDYTTEFSIQSSPAAQNGPEVYVLPLTEVSVPMSKQPARSGTAMGSASTPHLCPLSCGVGTEHWFKDSAQTW